MLPHQLVLSAVQEISSTFLFSRRARTVPAIPLNSLSSTAPFQPSTPASCCLGPCTECPLPLPPPCCLSRCTCQRQACLPAAPRGPAGCGPRSWKTRRAACVLSAAPHNCTTVLIPQLVTLPPTIPLQCLYALRCKQLCLLHRSQRKVDLDANRARDALRGMRLQRHSRARRRRQGSLRLAGRRGAGRSSQADQCSSLSDG